MGSRGRRSGLRRAPCPDVTDDPTDEVGPVTESSAGGIGVTIPHWGIAGIVAIVTEEPGHRAGHEAGYRDDKAVVLTRLRRVEGQIRGLQRMVENDTYCIDVLTQVSAATRALEGVALRLLDDHLRHCVAAAVQSGDATETDRIITEAMKSIERIVKS